MVKKPIWGLFMKKLFFPSLVLVSMMGLVACGGDNGLVKNGVAFKEGDAGKTSETVRQSVEGKVKSVTEKTSVSLSARVSLLGQTSKVSGSVSSKYDFNFDEGTVSGDHKMTVSSGGSKQTQSAVFDAKKQADGSFTFTKNTDRENYDEQTVAALYQSAEYSIYAWNFTMDLDSLLGAISSSGMDVLSGNELAAASALTSALSNKLVISGDATTGSFEIGIKEAVKLDIDLSSIEEASSMSSSSLPMTLTKMKYVFKDGFLRSQVAGISMNYNESGVGMDMNISSSTSYSYVMKK